MRLAEETIKEIEKNNVAISRLLAENEKILKANGYKPPTTNATLPTNERICIPSGYVRTKQYFCKRYHLEEIIRDETIISNIAYCLETSDIYNYFLNRFKIFGACETMLYKDSVINFVSVMESMLGQAAKNVRKQCAQCENHKSCKYYFNDKQCQFKNIMPKIEKYNMLRLSKERYKEILKAYKLRNHVHIFSASKVNELKDGDFNLKNYNWVVGLIYEVSEHIYEYMVPGMDGCIKKSLESIKEIDRS